MRAEITSYVKAPMGAYPGHYGMVHIKLTLNTNCKQFYRSYYTPCTFPHKMWYIGIKYHEVVACQEYYCTFAW